MAATPPMPPGSNTHQLNGKPNAKGNPLAEAINQHFQRKNQNRSPNPNPNQNPNASTPVSRSGSNEQLELLDHPSHPQQQQEAAGGKAKPSCHCTNISIMHLFHEMKQEFPTIPDAIVTQCVNENCHQRDNCIQMLRKELALHPIAVQSYPAKVLQQQQQQQHQNRQAKPPTPLKPSRVAPPQPEVGQSNGVVTPPHPRPRPTTLNLQRQFSTQLQQKIQQRQQRQQRDNQPPQLTPTSLSKPLRRAPPLPPPPKPKPGSFSNDSSCLTSPMSSSESELSLNAVSLSSPTSAAAATAATAAIASAQQQPSPVRHRSVITLQPEPPYARDFRSIDFPPTTTTCTPPLPSPSSAASPGVAAGGRKSFTSLNLTLRQPTGSAQSAIDITAGPAPSGQGSGITYSSVSFDARRGTHKNFQLTVTDEGSVFSAGCIRPRTSYASACEPVASVPANQQPQPPPAALLADGLGSADMDVFPYPTQEQNHIVASNYSNNHAASNNNNNGISSSVDSSPTMPLYEGVMEECDREVHAATIERQKQRRDKLANALRDNKKRLLVLEQEINILTEPVPVGESERLDRDILRLTEDCKRLLDCINEPQANGSGSAANPASNVSQQQQPQPFPRQRQGVRVQAPPNSLRLHSVPAAPTSQPALDFGQHHSSAPTSACLTPQQQQFQLQQEPPPTYAQYYQFQQYLQQQRQQQLQQLQLQQQHQQQLQQQQQPTAQQEEEFLSDSDVDEEEETLDSWACNMCTFRNHPQLNICEACENVRIQPGMIRIVPNGGGAAAAAAAATPPGNLEQQQQPPQQPYALHT
ncbi:TGF-beta-activated kinase 1 and MAP3K7-binding protein 3 isoform X1 [Drosophila takahashii]|uniref:TGF-beta-activated kinase 1 and MAP3K7-binding protein 3 isoform X1 n=1 Tax=Drosophila takahashii TaxID=29030 RepID=UPI00389930F0